MPAKAFTYTMRAGDAAVARYAAIEARARFQEALDLARSLPPSENAWRAQIEAVLKLASVAQNRTHFEQDLRNLEQAFALAETINDRESLCRIQYWMGRITYIFGHFDRAVELAGKALLIAEGLGGDDRFTADPVNLLGRIHCLRGEARDAITHAARNVQQMRRLGNRIEEAAMSGVLAFAYGMHGEFDQAGRVAALRHRGLAPDRASADPGCLPVLRRRGPGLARRSRVRRCRSSRRRSACASAPATSSAST